LTKEPIQLIRNRNLEIRSSSIHGHRTVMFYLTKYGFAFLWGYEDYIK